MAKGLSAQWVSLQDSERTGQVAYSFLLPKGWQNGSSFHWAGKSYVANLKATSPDGAYFVDKLEPMSMQYTSGSGQQSQGVQINKATDFLEAIVRKGQETGQSSNVKILEETNSDLPLTREQLLIANMPQTGGMFRKQFNQNGFLKVSYQHNGTQTISEMGATVARHQPRIAYADWIWVDRSAVLEHGRHLCHSQGDPNCVPGKSKCRADGVKRKWWRGATAIGDAFGLYCAKLALAMAIGAREATQRELEQFTENMREEGAKRQQQFRDQMRKG